MKKILFITLLFIFNFSFSQEIVEETILESTEVEETIIESTEASNVNQYYKNNSADIVTGEIDNSLLIFKGKNSSLYGLKDKTGKVLVKPIFYAINTYGSTKERIKASLSYGKEGVIDSKGNIIIPFEYSSLYNNRNMYTANKDGKTILLDYYGNKILKKSYDEVSIDNHFFKVKENGFYGMLNNSGDILLPIQYDELYYVAKEDWFVVTQNGISTILDSKGKKIFGNKYTSVSKLDYYFKFILVEKNGKFGIVDKLGNTISPLTFDAVEKEFNDHFFIVKQNGKWGLYNLIFRKFLLEPSYDHIKMLSNNYYLVKNQNSKTLIDILSGKKVDFTPYNVVNSYISNTMAIVSSDELKGAVNVESGKLVIPTKYKYLNVNTHYIAANLPDSRLTDVYSSNGSLLYENVSFIRSLNSDYKYTRVTVKGKVGLMHKGKEILPTEYRLIEDYKNFPFVLVKTDDKFGLVSLNNGSFLIPLSTSKIIVDSNKNSIIYKNKKYHIVLNKLVEIK